MYNYQLFDEEKIQFIRVGTTDELKEGDRLFLEIGELSIVLIRSGGQYYAIEDICSHDDGPLGDGEVLNFEISCPRHGAKFDIRSGQALTLPAIVDIPSYPVRISSGEIEIGIPIDK